MACVEIRKLYGGQRGTRVRGFELVIQNPEIHVILCTSISALDELVHIMYGTALYKSGTFKLNGKDAIGLRKKEIQYITMDTYLFPGFTVMDNIFMASPEYGFMTRKIIQKRFDSLMKEADCYIPNVRVENLTAEQKKMVEVIRCYEEHPQLLIVHELAGSLSYRNLMWANTLFTKLKNSGTTVLYLTSKGEDMLKIGDKVSVLRSGKNLGTFSKEEVLSTPQKTYYLMLGGQTMASLLEPMNEDENQDFVHTIVSGVKLLSQDSDSENVLKFFMRQVSKSLKAVNSIVYFSDRNSSKVRFISGVDYHGDELPLIKPDIVKQISSTEELFYTNYLDVHLGDLLNDRMNTHLIHTMICIPVKFGDNYLGLLQVYFDDDYAYTQTDKDYLLAIANELAFAIESFRLKGKSVLIQESHHRIKNNLQMIISLMELQKYRLLRTGTDVSSVQVSEAWETVVKQVKSIASIHDMLSKEEETDSIMGVDVIIRAIKEFYSNDADIQTDIVRCIIPHTRATSLALLVNELISNGVKHAERKEGRLTICMSLRREEDNYFFIYEDNGIGFPDGFEPWKSTGIGMTIMQSIVEQEFEGSFLCRNHHGGARIEITIPYQNFV